MRLSIILGARNAGSALAQTIQACIESIEALDYEIIVADDASTDASVDEVGRLFPQVRTVRHAERRGVAAARAKGAEHARGEVLLFADAPANPEFGAIDRISRDVELLGDQSIVTPAVGVLDVPRWTNDRSHIAHGYAVDLLTFERRPLSLAEMRPATHGARSIHESPAVLGCPLAVSRALYDRLLGFDVHMPAWGVEADLDLSMKCWLLGYRIVHDSAAVIGHRLRADSSSDTEQAHHIVANQIRAAFKHFTFTVWSEWIERCRQRTPQRLEDHPEGVWADAWRLFEAERANANEERRYLLARRRLDEFQYASRFELSWPRLETATPPAASFAFGAGGGLSVSPSGPPPAARIAITSPATNATFAITGAPGMPSITATAQISGIVPDPTPTTSFEWTVRFATTPIPARMVRIDPSTHPISCKPWWVAGSARISRSSAAVS